MTTTARLAAAIAVFLICGTASAVPPLEQLLERAMHSNPDVVAARAQAELANAELNLARMKAARECVALHARMTAQTRSVQLIREQLKEDPKDRKLMQTLIAEEALLAETNAQLSYMIGDGSRVRPPSPPGPHTGPPAPARPPLNTAMAVKIGKALSTPVSLEFIETPLGDVGDYLEDSLDIPIIVDKSVADLPMTLRLKGVPLGAATQSIQDTMPDIRFTVRAYGILVTSGDSADRGGFISATEFWKQTSGAKPIPPEVKPESGPERKPVSAIEKPKR